MEKFNISEKYTICRSGGSRSSSSSESRNDALSSSFGQQGDNKDLLCVLVAEAPNNPFEAQINNLNGEASV